MTHFILLAASLFSTSCGEFDPVESGSTIVHQSARELLPADQSRPLVGLPQFPALSPDGRSLVFGWAGDLWVVSVPRPLPAVGPVVVLGSRLTSHPAEERFSAFSPDGATLAFESDRDGARNIYLMPIASVKSDSAATQFLGGEVRRLTYSDSAQSLGSFSSDAGAGEGGAVLFSSAQEPSVYRQARLFRAPLDGGAVTRLTDAQGFNPRAAADGSSILFTRGFASIWDRPAYRGPGAMDVYRFSPGQGTFAQITSSDANDGDAFPLPDGSVVFVSSRDGQNNVWKIAAGKSDSEAEQLTAFKASPDQVTIGHGVRDLAVSADGSTAAFVVWDTLYVLDLKQPGSNPMQLAVTVMSDSSESTLQRINVDKQVSEAVLSPDAKTMAFVTRGEIFVRSMDEGRPTRRVTTTPWRERDLAWSPDGRVLYFSSDEPGVYAIYQATVRLTREETQPKASPKPSEPADGPVAASEPGAAADEPAEEKRIAADGADMKPDSSQKKSDSKPDAKPDHGKRWAEAILFDVQQVISGEDADCRRPVLSPDGKRMLYIRGRGDLVHRDVASGAERVLLSGWDEPDVIWAGDSRHIIYSVSDLDYNSDLWLMDVDAAEPGGAVNLTNHPDTDVSPRLSADGKVLTFLSERAGENGEFDVWQLFLDKKLEGMKAYELDEYFKKGAEAAGKRKPLGAATERKDGQGEKAEGGGAAEKDAKPSADAAAVKDAAPVEPFKFDLEDAYLRVRRLTSYPGSEGDLQITPAADRIVFSATVDNERSLVSVDRKGEDRKVLQAGGVSSVGVSLTGDKVTFVRAGAASTVPVKGGKVEAVAIDAPITIDIPKQQRQKFLEAARILGTRFYHNTMKGLDWAGLTRRYLSLAMQTRTSEEFNAVVAMLFGELNGSHTGISGGGAAPGPKPAVGMLGVSVAPTDAGFRVLSVLQGSPADQDASRLDIGDVIIAVDGVKVTEVAGVEGEAREGRAAVPDFSLVMLGKAGKETLLEVERADPERPRFVLIVPLSNTAFVDVAYRAEIRRRQRLVETLSGGKLGYLHIRSMGDASVRDFERDIFAAGHGKDGLIIDVRDNGGGYTTDILLASLTAPAHAKTAPRGVDPLAVPADTYPRDRRLIYAFARPINVLINENSFSNAEVFAHAIKTIKRGTLVGTKTFGGVISTGATSLIDGTTVRVPGRGWWLPDGNEMENNGASPDVDVPQRPDDEVAGRDAQIEAAVKELLGRVGTK